jgi:hypothetical protein
VITREFDAPRDQYVDAGVEQGVNESMERLSELLARLHREV